MSYHIRGRYVDAAQPYMETTYGTPALARACFRSAVREAQECGYAVHLVLHSQAGDVLEEQVTAEATEQI